jgi:hypothetical protein
MRLTRRITTLLAALGTALALAGSAGAGGANHVVIAQNTTDGATVVHAGTQVVPVATDDVTSSNIATAVNAGCIGCHSTAVSVQILIVKGSPSPFDPANFAGAFNGGCDGCGAFAFARQYWIQVDQTTNLSTEARDRVAALRAEIADAAASILPSDAATDPCMPYDHVIPVCSRDYQLNSLLMDLSDQLIQVVTNDLQAQGDATATLFDGVQDEG